jgi:hypothetical protein
MITGFFLWLSAIFSPHFPAYFRLFLADKWRTVGVSNPTKMSIQITGKVTRNGEKKWYTFEWGKGADQRKAAGIFTYVRPKDQIQKNYNKEAVSRLSNSLSGWQGPLLKIHN